MVEIALNQVTWPRYHRLVNSAYPPIDLFDDIADPKDWPLLGSSESRTNPRLSESMGRLELIPPSRRVGGSGASWVMAPFTHATTDKPGRFHDGSFGAFYAANNYQTALFETVHHVSLFNQATNQASGWIADMRELVGSIDTILTDSRVGDYQDILHPDDYSFSQQFAKTIIAKGNDGIVYPSVRDKGGECFAAFYPDVMSIPIQGKHISYHWNGERIDLIKDLTEHGKVYRIS